MLQNRRELTLDTNRGYHISCLDGSLPGQKAIIICLHGFAGSKRSPRIERLHEEMSRYQIGTFTFDWPAHGDSDAAYQKLTIENCMKDLEDVCKYVDENVLESYKVPVYCFATSFGGYLAMLYHQSQPEAFRKILLRSPALKMGQVMKAFMNEDQFRNFLEGTRLDFGLDQPLLLARDFYEDVCRHDVFQQAPEHPDRILIIHGDRDQVVPPRHSMEYAQTYGIPVRFLEGADHSYDHPGEVDWVMERAKEFFTVQPQNEHI